VSEADGAGDVAAEHHVDTALDARRTTSAGVPWVSAVGVKQSGMPRRAMRSSSDC
jgi:hypothetical protein